jgi:uncharacterized Tic20 family protein
MTDQPPLGPPPGAPPPPSQPPGQFPGPGPLSVSEERNWAMAAHLGSLVAAAVAMAFLAPLAVMLMTRGRSEFVRHHAVESLNFQISVLIYAAISVALIFVLIGLVLLVVLGVFWLVAVILGGVAASQGHEFRYPLNIRFIS